MSSEGIYAGKEKGPRMPSLTGIADEGLADVAFISAAAVDIAKITDSQAQCPPVPWQSPLGELREAPRARAGAMNPSLNAASNQPRQRVCPPTKVPNLKLVGLGFSRPPKEVYVSPPSQAGVYSLAWIPEPVYSSTPRPVAFTWSIKRRRRADRISIGTRERESAANMSLIWRHPRERIHDRRFHGKEIWKVKVEDHPVAKKRGPPSIYEDRLYVPVSSQRRALQPDGARSNPAVPSEARMR